MLEWVALLSSGIEPESHVNLHWQGVLYLKRHVGSPGDHYSSAQRLRALRKGGVAVTPRVRFPEPSGVHSSPSPSPRGTQADVPIGQKAWPSG